MRNTLRAVVIVVVAMFVPGSVLVTVAAAQGPAQVPCSDPAGCPDLVVSQLGMAFRMVLDDRRISPKECMVQEDEAKPGHRRLLRFNFISPNVGRGDLIIGTPADHPELFEFGTCHGHPHFKAYADYRLWTPAGYAAWQALRAAHPDALPAALLARNPKIARDMVAGNKQGFCVADRVSCLLLPPLCFPHVPQGVIPLTPRYETCEQFQGISVGWADVYDITLDGQWVEVDSLQGTFVLEAEVNPERLFQESSYTNNSAAVCVNIPARGGATAAPLTPGCVDPTEMAMPTTCELCLHNCAGLPGCSAEPGGSCGDVCAS